MRADLSRAALRALGSVAVLRLALLGVSYSAYSRLEGAVERPPETMRLLHLLSVLHFAAVVALIATLALLAFARARHAGRGLAVAATGLGVARLALGLYNYARPPQTTADFERVMWIYVAIALLDIAAVVVAMLAVTNSKRRVPLAAAVGVTALALTLAPRMLHVDSLLTRFTLQYALMAGADLALAAGPILLAQFAADTPAQTSDAKGGPLRLLASAFGLRLVIGIGVVVATTVSLATKNADLASMWAGLGAIASFACSVAIIVGLFGHLRSDPPGMNALFVMFAIVAILLATVIDVWATSVAMELYGIVAKLQRADSFFGVPGAGKLEELQETARSAMRIQLALAVATTLSLAASFRATARAHHAAEADALSSRLMWLTVIAAAVAVGVGMMLESAKTADLVLTLIAGVAATCLGIWVAVSWLRLLRALADALDVSEPRGRAAS